jgi:hypothetical protein
MAFKIYFFKKIGTGNKALELKFLSRITLTLQLVGRKNVFG